MRRPSLDPSPSDKILQLVDKQLFVRARDVERMGVSRVYLLWLCDKGKLVRIGWGIYRRPGVKASGQYTLAEVAKRVPSATICLESALVFHKLSKTKPAAVSIAMPPATRKPSLDTVVLRVHRSSGPALTGSREKHLIGGIPVLVYNPAKTVADCFKFRNKIGLDVALRALRTSLRRERATLRQIKHYAKICRVLPVMRPYLDAL